MTNKTLSDYLRDHTRNHPDRLWLRERKGDEFRDLTWQQGNEQINAVAAWLEKRFAGEATNVALLSRNRPHWFLADLATIVSGNITVPLFTTLSEEHAKYVCEFAEVKLLFLGETANWGVVRKVLPEGVEIVTLPGTDCELPHSRWEDIVAENVAATVKHVCDYDETMSIVFTSGTTGVPKGVIQTHRSLVAPNLRTQFRTDIPQHPRAFSYLPLAHIAERSLVEVYSIIFASEVTFNESLDTLVRDLHDARPHYLFGAPRVWEQLQQGVTASFGSARKLNDALAADGENVARAIREKLGLQDAMFLVTGAAPAPPSMLRWYAKLQIPLVEGFGQSEAMGVACCTMDDNRVGSIGRPVDGVEIKIGENQELLIRADGLSPGYYKQPGKTAELWQDGWLHTGDKASVDADGFIFISGRVKDYFKTIHGKFVAPAPIESQFAACTAVEQLCLLGRGYSKTVMICVLAAEAVAEKPNVVEAQLREQVQEVNEGVEHHAKIGAVIVSDRPWTIDNGILTPTLKIRRDEVETLFGERSEALARQAAESHEEIIEWAQPA
jgi:long-chain acyl-CoA synthetase